MFPPMVKDDCALVIYIGHKVSLGIQLVVDGVWRYSLDDNEQITVQLRKPDDTVALEKVYTQQDVDSEDKIVNVTLDSEDTSLPAGKYFLVAFADDYVLFPPQPVIFRKVVC